MSKRDCFAEPTKYIDVIPESIGRWISGIYCFGFFRRKAFGSAFAGMTRFDSSAQV